MMIINLSRKLRRLWNMMVMVIPIGIGVIGMVPKGSERGLEGLESSGSDHSDDSIIENAQNVEESPTDLSRLAVS